MMNPYSKSTILLTLNLALLFLVVLMALVFAGYSNLAISLMVNVLQTLLILSLCITLHQLTKNYVFCHYRQFAQFLSKPAIWVYWLMALVNTLTALGAVFLLLLIWGLSLEQLLDWWKIIVIKGIKIGDSFFSVSYLLRAVIIYLVIYYFFKWLALLLEKKILNHTELDKGTQNAIITFTGYIGLALAIVTAVYSLGISSTSIAFILSAFTFGISFGLKEIFSNIVSGLILLIERPIKVGDLIMFENERATVKKIQLRATVVETRQRQVMLVPNSSLITSVLRNDSLNPITRLDILVECGYSEDAEKVSNLLLELAKATPQVLSSPKPNVVFNNFNPSGLQFKLSAYTELTNRKLVVNYLRHKILETFRQHDIEIPYQKQIVFFYQGKEEDRGAS